MRAVADDLGIEENVLNNWRKKYTAEGNKTPMATLEEELKMLRLENAELKMERDMLKKAAAYFAKLQKKSTTLSASIRNTRKQSGPNIWVFREADIITGSEEKRNEQHGKGSTPRRYEIHSYWEKAPMEPAEYAESYDKTDFPAASIRSVNTWTSRGFDVSTSDGGREA